MDTKAKIQIYDNKEAQLEEIDLPHQDVKYPETIEVSSFDWSFKYTIVI
jgi:hypothetical protein